MHVEDGVLRLEAFADQRDPMPFQDSSPTWRKHRRDSRNRPSVSARSDSRISNERCRTTLQEDLEKVRRQSPVVTQPALVESKIQREMDQTMDLSIPRSRSGQHWKAEFDQYYQKSDQEMKRMILYGQNVKSYAVQKDSEASGLLDQVNQEKARADALERKIGRLDEQLKIAQAKDPKGVGDRSRLVSELAQQTALVKEYELMLKVQRLPRLENDDMIVGSGGYDAGVEVQKDAALPEDMRALQEAAQTAETKALELQVENDVLKRSMARVKQEMMGYESRRQAREERLKKREERYKTAKEDAEAQVVELKAVNEKLMQAGQEKGPDLVQVSMVHPRKTAETMAEQRVTISGNSILPQSKGISPRRRLRQKSSIDIWTQSSPATNDAKDSESRLVEASAIPPSSVKDDIKRALKEINSNLGAASAEIGPTTHGLATAKPMKDPIGYEDGVAIWPDTSRAMVRDQSSKRLPASSPAKRQTQSQRVSPRAAWSSDRATTGRSASMSSRRTGSLASRRAGHPMTAERVAETRARLAKRNADKRKANAMT